MTAVQDHLPTSIDELQAQLESSSLPKQLQQLSDIAAAGEPGLSLFMDFLRDRPPSDRPSEVIIRGTMYQYLVADRRDTTQAFLQQNLPDGVVPLQSDRSIDYRPLQQLLAQQDFEEADRVTLQKMCELSGETAIARKWLYFTEVDGFPISDLCTIDRLWLAHSQGKFGFSVQRELWLGSGKNWDVLWSKIGWRTEKLWTRYPNEFTWDLSAPRGHLPLTNQLRGVRVMAALMKHPAWSDR